MSACDLNCTGAVRIQSFLYVNLGGVLVSSVPGSAQIREDNEPQIYDSIPEPRKRTGFPRGNIWWSQRYYFGPGDRRTVRTS